MMTSQTARLVHEFHDLEGKKVGYVETNEDGAYKISLDKEWSEIDNKINEAISNNSYLLGPGRRFCKVEGNWDEDRKAIAYTVWVLSKFQIRG